MENIASWKTNLTKQNASRYILVPKNILKYEGINDEDIIEVTVKIVEKKDENTRR